MQAASERARPSSEGSEGLSYPVSPRLGSIPKWCDSSEKGVYIYFLIFAMFLIFVISVMSFSVPDFHSDSGADCGASPDLPRGQGTSPLHFTNVSPAAAAGSMLCCLQSIFVRCPEKAAFGRGEDRFLDHDLGFKHRGYRPLSLRGTC